jgi:hypothetical protein
MLRHHGRGERAGTIPGHRDPHLADIGAHRFLTAAVTHVAGPGPLTANVAEMLAELDIQGGS